MRKIILPLFLVFAYTGVFAQKQVIRITVVNEQKNALPGATVYLLNTDSAVSYTHLTLPTSDLV